MNKLTILFVALVATTTPPALAANADIGNAVVPDGVPYRLIDTAGLDLSSPATVRKLQVRVHWAAESVCPKNLELDDMVPSPERRDCLNKAVGQGLAQIEAKRLAAVNSARATRTVAYGQ